MNNTAYTWRTHGFTTGYLWDFKKTWFHHRICVGLPEHMVSPPDICRTSRTHGFTTGYLWDFANTWFHHRIFVGLREYMVSPPDICGTSRTHGFTTGYLWAPCCSSLKCSQSSLMFIYISCK
jgi:hypothetical protein